METPLLNLRPNPDEDQDKFCRRVADIVVRRWRIGWMQAIGEGEQLWIYWQPIMALPTGIALPEQNQQEDLSDLDPDKPPLMADTDVKDEFGVDGWTCEICEKSFHMDKSITSHMGEAHDG